MSVDIRFSNTNTVYVNAKVHILKRKGSRKSTCLITMVIKTKIQQQRGFPGGHLSMH